MASLAKRPTNKNGTPGNYYIRLWLPNQKRSKSIPIGTANKKEAEQILKRVEHFEYLRKAEQTVIKALYNDTMSDQWIAEGIENDLGIDQSVSLKNAIEKFLDDIKRRNLSKNTFLLYQYGLRGLQEALGHNFKITEIGKCHLQVVLRYLGNENTCDSSINAKLRAIRAFFNWLEENDFIRAAPFKIKLIKLEKTLPKFVYPKELQAIYDNTADPMLISVFKVYEGTGMRLAELRNSKLKNGFLMIMGKGRKERIVPLPDSLLEDYKIAMSYKKCDHRITKEFTIARKKAGITRHITLHSLRHTYAVKKVMELDNIKYVQELLGHQSVVQTEQYAQFPKALLREVFSPISTPVLVSN